MFRCVSVRELPIYIDGAGHRPPPIRGSPIRPRPMVGAAEWAHPEYGASRSRPRLLVRANMRLTTPEPHPERLPPSSRPGIQHGDDAPMRSDARNNHKKKPFHPPLSLLAPALWWLKRSPGRDTLTHTCKSIQWSGPTAWRCHRHTHPRTGGDRFRRSARAVKKSK